MAQATPTVSISNLPASGVYNGSFTATYTVTAGDAGATSVTSNSTSVCTVSGNTVTYVGVGTCSLTANVAATTNFTDASGTAQTFNVGQATPTVSIANLPASGVYNGSFSATYTVTAGDAGATSVTSNSTSVCTVSGNTVTYVGVGTCSLTAHVAATTDFAAANGTAQTFNVAQATQTITYTSTAPSGAVYSGSNSQSYTPTATGGASGNAVTFTIDASSTSGCAITSGVVKYGSGVGTCVIDANQTGNTNYSAATQVQQTFNVGQATPTVSISNLPASGVYNGSFSATYTVTAGDAGATSVTSNSTSVCTVSGNTVSYVGIGTCSLTAHVAATTTFAAASGTAQTFSVAQATPTVSISNLPASGVYNGSFTATYTVTAGDAGATSVTSNSTSVCTVSGNTVTYVGVGTCSLTANVAATTNFTDASGTAQTFNVGQATPTVSIANLPASGVYNGSFSATYTVTAGDAGATSVTSNSTSVCTVSGNTVTYVGVGTCSLTAHVAATTDFAAANGTAQTFNVAQATQTITYTSTAPSGAVYSGSNSQSYTPTATGGASGNAVTFTIDASSTSGCAITSGVVKYGSGVGTCVIDANQTGNTNYSAATQVQQTFNVGQATPTVSISNLPASGVYNGSFSATYTVTAGDAGATSVTSNSTSVCTVSGNTVSYINVGTCSLTAHVGAATGFAAASGTAQTFNVGQATPTVSIANLPASGVYNGSFTPTYNVTGGDAGATSVTSNSTSVCTVSGTTVNYVGVGTCSLTSHVAATTFYAAANGTAQTFSVGQASQTITFTSAAPTNSTSGGSNSQSYTPTATGGASGNAVTFTIDASSTSGCVITAGVVKYGLNVGTCVIDANQTGNTDYSAATQVQQTFKILGISYWSGTSTSAVVTTSSSVAFPAAGEPVLIFMTFESASTGATCGTPTGTSLAGTPTSFLATTNWLNTGGNRFYMCVYSGVSTATSATVSDTLSKTATNGTIQVVAITGDNTATFSLAKLTGGTSASPTWALTATPSAGSDEFLFGALSNAGTEPTWNAISGFSNLGSFSVGSGTTGNVATLYAGFPSAISISGTTSASATWETYGIEVTP